MAKLNPYLNIPGNFLQQILHGVLEKGDLILMASDMVNCTSEEECQLYFTRLSASGEINEPFQQMFWGGYFGALTDRLGILGCLIMNRGTNG